MAAVVPRWMWQNFVQLGNTLIFSSSVQINFPDLWLRDPLRSKRWRSKMGWTIVAGFNDKIDITEGVTGDATATLTPGTYATGALMAAEIQTQLNAAATDNTWTCTYDGTTNKFTIGHNAAETGGIEWSTGTNGSAAAAPTNAGIDLGFDVSADDTGASSYVADSISYQSRHQIWFDIGTAFEVKAGIIFDSNLDSADSVNMLGHTSSTFSNPDFEQALTYGATEDLFAKQFAGQSFRWWAFELIAVQNADGFVEVGIPFVGNYTQPSVGYFKAYAEPRSELSNIQVADKGAHFQNPRPTRRQYSLQWPGLTANDKSNYDNIINFVKVGRSFFFALDSGADETNIIYAYLSSAATFTSVPVGQWSIPFVLNEALG